ncbi:MAG TPA: MgtC/SapB family protein [Thermoanaerobaculia bacterium]|nr:MgtC/SapB family protein [Thermoanaerobaculia bacterium]
MPPSPLPEMALRLAVAALAGLAVGIEREWTTQKSARAPRLAGVRTFLLLGVLGGVAAELAQAGLPGAALALAAAAAGLVVVAYASSVRSGDVDATTEVAALVVVGAGAFAGYGWLALASGLSVATAFVLLEKSRIHDLVYRIRSEELSAGMRFAVLALVVLPLLPEGPFGPDPGVKPRAIWSLVLVFSGLSFASFIALRVAGPAKGYGVSGLLGGLISSTAVTMNFSRESAKSPPLGPVLALGVLAACTVLYLRVLVLSVALNADVGLAALRFVLPPLFAGAALLLAFLRRFTGAPVAAAEPSNPLRLVSAVTMALAFQAVLYLMHWVQPRFGAEGVLLSAAIVGLTDADALTVSMTTLGRDPSLVPVAARALAVGALSNTLFKLALAAVLGRGSFRRIGLAGLGILVAAGAAALFFPL